MLFSCRKCLHIVLGDGWGSLSQVSLLGWGLEGSEVAVWKFCGTQTGSQAGGFLCVCVWDTHLCLCVSAIMQALNEKFQNL